MAVNKESFDKMETKKLVTTLAENNNALKAIEDRLMKAKIRAFRMSKLLIVVLPILLTLYFVFSFLGRSGLRWYDILYMLIVAVVYIDAVKTYKKYRIKSRI